MINSFLELLQDKGLLLSDQAIDECSEAQPLLHDGDIADTLWLAYKMGGCHDWLDKATDMSEDDRETLTIETVDLPPLVDSQIPSLSMSVPNVQTSAVVEPEVPNGGMPIQVQASPALPDTREIGRVLRPLMRKVPSLRRSVLDDLATVNRIAERDIWLPILKPFPERWLDLELVTESSKFSFLWQDTLAEFQHLLEYQGAFRNVRIWSIEGAETNIPRLVTKTQKSSQMQSSHSPKELVDVSGRRLVLLISDCRSNLWRQGIIYDWLALWGRHGPASIVQLLPERLWQQSELNVGFSVQVESRAPGTPSHKLQVRELLRHIRISPTDSLTVPVVTLTANALKQWALVLVGAGHQRTPARLFDRSWVQNSERAAAVPGIKPGSPEARLELFNATASPLAQQLASRMAAVPVDLSVVYMIQQELLPQITPVHIAEVYASSLLEAVETQPSEFGETERYDFAPGVRVLLNKVTPLHHTLEVIEVLSQRLARILGFEIKSFTALLSPKSAWSQEVKEAILPFAQVATEVLHRLGGDYAELARQVELDAQGRSDWIQPIEQDEPDPVAEFPPLTPFEFIDARFTDGAEIPLFPPPLETETFTILTLEAGQPSEVTQALEPFDITVATLIDNQGQWQVQRQQQTARRYVELLPEKVALEMVAIPGDTFTMGSPDDELERDGDESPQHEVTIELFFMGRYPITQAQWRLVAALPQVERKLEVDPSNFKGDNRPVEKVSWYDAVEFCARLFVHTGREYRLPTEAEWEYACRAGTTTAFHFGDMITTEVANYNGSAYAEGPEGKDRDSTTPVDEFGFANTFGLSDMHGNVYEWCQDQWHDSYEDASTDGSAWLIPDADDEDTERLMRGGSWADSPWYCRSAYRLYHTPGYRFYDIGFRVVCSALRILP